MWCRWRAVPEVSQSDWLRAYNNLLWFRGRVEEKTFMLKYEDLIEHPDRVMKNICGFLSLEWLPQLGEGLHRNSMNKWRNDPLFGFQPEEQVKTLGRHLGYSSAELHAPDRRLWPFYRRMLVATYPGVQLYRKQRRRLASLMRPR
jgi:hypothetical protein